MKIRSVLLWFVVLPMIASCSTTPLTEKGSHVTFALAEQNNCKQLGRVFAQDWWYGNVDDIKHKLRNQAGELGGNVIVLENRPPWGAWGNRNSAYGLAFNCPKKIQNK